ncbi:hypothetical protein DSBG_1197 [Desulfosporosinus sp. BG]|nr:hypothetical protein DSBG_1197 [Desulfosporosinus sp. BG]
MTRDTIIMLTFSTNRFNLKTQGMKETLIVLPLLRFGI